jgi:hypothetical protein
MPKSILPLRSRGNNRPTRRPSVPWALEGLGEPAGGTDSLLSVCRQAEEASAGWVALLMEDKRG